MAICGNPWCKLILDDTADQKKHIAGKRYCLTCFDLFYAILYNEYMKKLEKEDVEQRNKINRLRFGSDYLAD